MQNQNQNQNQNQPPRIIRLPEVVRLTGKARAQVYDGMKRGTFPKCFKIGSRAVGWNEAEIWQWIKDRIAQTRKS